MNISNAGFVLQYLERELVTRVRTSWFSSSKSMVPK